MFPISHGCHRHGCLPPQRHPCPSSSLTKPKPKPKHACAYVYVLSYMFCVLGKVDPILNFTGQIFIILGIYRQKHLRNRFRMLVHGEMIPNAAVAIL